VYISSSAFASCVLAKVVSEDLVQEPKIFETEEESVSLKSAAHPWTSGKGKLLKSIHHWQKLRPVEFILSIVRDGYKIPFH